MHIWQITTVKISFQINLILYIVKVHSSFRIFSEGEQIYSTKGFKPYLSWPRSFITLIFEQAFLNKFNLNKSEDISIPTHESVIYNAFCTCKQHMCKKSWKKCENALLRKIHSHFFEFFLLKFLHNNMLWSYNFEKDEKLFITYHKMSSKNVCSHENNLSISKQL